MNYFGLLPEELIQKFALLKRNCFASVFEKYFDYQQAGSGGKTQAVINYREDESMWVKEDFFNMFYFFLLDRGSSISETGTFIFSLP